MILLRMNQGHPTMDTVLVLIDHRNLEALMSGHPLTITTKDSRLAAEFTVAYGHELLDLVDQLAATGKFSKEQIAEIRQAAERVSE